MINYENMTKEQVIGLLKDTLEYAEEKDKEIDRLKNIIVKLKKVIWQRCEETRKNEQLERDNRDKDKEIERLNKEVEKYKKRCYEALRLIRDNYGVLDKYGIDLLDDILNGK